MDLMRRERARATEKNFELYFLTEVLKLPSLHFGYWEEGTASGEFDLDEIAAAQALFTQKLLSFVPKDVSNVLDVGAGVGDNARALARAGYRVTSISPDQNHRQYFDAIDQPGISFRQSKFEDFKSDEKFDLLFFSESHRYFNRHVGLQQCRKLVSPGGYLLVCGMFRYADRKNFPKDFDLTDLDYVKAAGEYGFVPDRVVDITANILPTMKVMNRAIREYVDPSVEMAQSYLQARAPLKAALLKLLFSRQLSYVDHMLGKYRRRSKPRHFQKKYRYATLLLRDNQRP